MRALLKKRTPLQRSLKSVFKFPTNLSAVKHNILNESQTLVNTIALILFSAYERQLRTNDIDISTIL